MFMYIWNQLHTKGLHIIFDIIILIHFLGYLEVSNKNFKHIIKILQQMLLFWKLTPLLRLTLFVSLGKWGMMWCLEVDYYGVTGGREVVRPTNRGVALRLAAEWWCGPAEGCQWHIMLVARTLHFICAILINTF